MARPLSIRYHRGDDIPEALLREVWALRLEFLTLTRSREDDWAFFSRFLRGPDRCLFAFVDPAGTAQGFFTVAFLPHQRRDLLMYSKYFYFRPAYRGHHKTMMAPWRLLPMALRRYGLRRLHFVTTAFPQSYVSLSRSSGQTWSLRDDDTPPRKRTALLAFARHFCGDHFDEAAGLVGGANVADAESLPRSVEGQRLFARYEVLNPRWRSGNSLPILFSVDHRLVFHNLKRMLRQRLTRR